MVKRGKLEIMKDILRIIQENRNSIKPTPLLRKSKLSSLRFKEYYMELMEKDLVKEITDTGGDNFIILTEKGFMFLEKYLRTNPLCLSSFFSLTLKESAFGGFGGQKPQRNFILTFKLWFLVLHFTF